MLSQEELRAVLVERHGEQMQAKLERAHVAIAGCGGLGSNVAIALARIGVGRLHLVDFDRVDPSNLNRQHYFQRHLGLPKVEALKEQILEINPYLAVQTSCERVTADSVQRLFGDADIVCEAFDVAENKAMLVNAVLEQLPQTGLVAASGLAGYGESNSIRTRQVSERFFLCGDEQTGIEAGASLMAPRVLVAAGHEANIIVQMIMSR